MKPKMSWCRNCYNIYYRQWSKTPKAKATKKRYRNTPKAKKRIREYYRKWYAKNGRSRAMDYAEAIIEWQKNHPEAKRAHGRVKYALKIGTLKRPEKCSAIKKHENNENRKPWKNLDLIKDK